MEEMEVKQRSTECLSSSNSNKERAEKLDKTLEIIESSSVKTKEVYKGLVYIRTKLLNHPEGVKLLESEKCYKCLIKMLLNTHEVILNITISILSNLCNNLIMNEEFREEIRKTKTAGRIMVILRKSSKGTIQKRICRLIGNLAQANDLGEELHRAGVTYGVVHILNGAEDIELQHTAIRALRWLWHVDRHHGDMLKSGVIKAVANHLSSPDIGVEKAALRALVKFTHQRSVYMAEQMSGKYEKIVEKIEEPVVTVLILNLSQDPIARVELCKAGVVPPILDRLQQGRTNSYLISGLCQMCREPMVRANLRLTPNGFSTLLSLLSGEKTKRFYPEILDAITQFNYDQPSLMLMVRSGLIGVLVEKLGEYSKVHCLGHTEAVPQEEMGSPLSPASPSPVPSPSPPPFSPPSALDFSPRCPFPPSDSDDSDSEPSFISQVERFGGDSGLDGCVLDVLKRLTYQGTPMRALAAKATISALLDYISRLPYPRFQANFHKAVSALNGIVGCKFYWNMLLDDESVLEIHAKLCRPLHEDCWECKRLADTGKSILREVGLTAQSGLGEGEITYRLTGTSNTSRITAALTVPHVIRQANLLETLLYSHGGMKVLLESLSSRTLEAVSSLHSLFSTLRVHNPQLPCQMCGGCEVGRVRKESTVMLTVDGGSTVAANREALTHACPVFEAMFRGGFKESAQSTVRISEISAPCLSHLTRVLPEYCSCALPKELPVLLEMISASDRFLLPELMERVVGVVRDSALAPVTVPQIYSWGLRCGHQYPLTSGLALDVVSYIFAADVLPKQRAQAVSTILASDDRDPFLRDISSITRTALTTYTKTERIFKFKS